jgi:hypothetical protein
MLSFSPTSHLSRRALLKGLLLTAGGGAVMNWGNLKGLPAVAEEVKRKRKHCILLWMNGGASQFETFDMKPGRETDETHLAAADIAGHVAVWKLRL